MKILFSIVFLALSILGFSQKEILKDPISLKIAEKAIAHLDNFQFSAFDKEVEKLKVNYGKHPSYPLLKSMSLYYQSLVDMNRKGEHLEYLNLLNKVIDYSEEMLKTNPESTEGLFFALSGYGYRAQYYSDHDHFFRAINEGKKSYKYFKKGQKLKKELNEFYFMTGLFGYYIEQYPENHPVIKPLMSFFQKGNKVKGLQELDYASKNAVFTKGTAYIYTAYLYTKFEANYNKGKQYSGDFYRLNPKNTLNKTNYILALMLNKDYRKALPLLNSLKNEKNEYYQMAYHLFKGWYMLEMLDDKKVALEDFEIAELLAQKNPRITLDLYTITCYKKAQVYEASGLKDKAKNYYKKAVVDSGFKEIERAYRTFQAKK